MPIPQDTSIQVSLWSVFYKALTLLTGFEGMPLGLIYGRTVFPT